MSRAVAKATAHTAGGAENAAYIGRPQEERSREAEMRPGEEPVAGRGERLAEMREGDAEPARGRAAEGSDDDPVWGWNVPWFITGDGHGIWETEEGRTLLESRSLAMPARHLGLGPAPASAAKLSVEEKRENLIAHFSALADLEERQKGLSHFRIILTVGPEVSIGELKAMANAFLRANFPLCPAFVAIHDDTQHRHAHVYVHARQLDQRRVALGQDYFRLDESWMEITAKRLNDPEIYERHVELKEETRRWRERAEKAREVGKPLPSKPDRWGDHHDTVLVFRPYDDRWCGRLQAQLRVAEKRVEWLEATKARPENVTVARDEAGRLRARLDEAAAKRAQSRSKAKRGMPAEVVTVSEARELLLYARDINKAGKGKVSRRMKPAPTRRAEQGVLRFDEPLVERGEQPGFDFQSPPEPERATGPTRPHARAELKPPARERGKAEVSAASAAAAPASSREAARSFGRELVSEVKLALTESRLSSERSAKERRLLKEQLIKDRREYARAYEEAGRHRSALAALGTSEPPCRLKEGERDYLQSVTGGVSERLRERIEAEVARARIIPDREEETPARRAPEPAPPAETPHPVPSKAEPTQPARDGRPGGEAANTKLGEPTPDVVRQEQAASTPPAEPARGGTGRTLPDDVVRELTIQYELAKARAAVLHAAEEDFNAAPHRWVSPRYKVSLAELEEKVAGGWAGGADVGRPHEARERIRDELEAERIQLPLRRRRADDEWRSLEARLRHEKASRDRLGLEMPDVIPTAGQLRDLVSCAEAARDARQLRRLYEVERDLALREAEESGSGKPVQRLEERYAGVKLMAEVRADRSSVALARDAKDPDKTLLPATDEAGRDAVATLEQAGTRKRIMGTLGRLFESGDRRRLREQLLGAKEAYLGHLRADAETRDVFLETAREIARECREQSTGFGYFVPAVPELSPEQIREARDYAATRKGTEREDWLSACAQSQKLKEEEELAAAAAGRRDGAHELVPPGAPAGEERAELIREELEAYRERETVETQEPTTKSVADRDQPGGPDKSLPEPEWGDEEDWGR